MTQNDMNELESLRKEASELREREKQSAQDICDLSQVVTELTTRLEVAKKASTEVTEKQAALEKAAADLNAEIEKDASYLAKLFVSPEVFGVVKTSPDYEKEAAAVFAKDHRRTLRVFANVLQSVAGQTKSGSVPTRQAPKALGRSESVQTQLNDVDRKWFGD
jgi:predicted nuclease with TOPRIM domain